MQEPSSTSSPQHQHSRRSLDQKRKSVEEKLNAVLEKQLSNAADARQVALRKQTSQEPSGSLKSSCSMGDIKAAAAAIATRRRSQEFEAGSARNLSAENLSGKTSNVRTPKKKEIDTVDRPQDRTGSSINVSVITSTPIKNNLTKNDNGDVVVITSKVFIYWVFIRGQ